tara:strand:+ start:5441 stop:5851 length:411 start_codon:yes stop_codon:yes gene_type:complete
MTTTRDVAQKFMDCLCAQAFSDAFDLLSDDADYQIIGTTAVSAPMKGRDTVKATLVPALASFQKPPKLTCHEIIVDGERAVGLASGSGVGPTGLNYEQPHYAMVMRVRDGKLVSVMEFADTVAVEVALLGKKLVDA